MSSWRWGLLHLRPGGYEVTALKSKLCFEPCLQFAQVPGAVSQEHYCVSPPPSGVHESEIWIKETGRQVAQSVKPEPGRARFEAVPSARLNSLLTDTRLSGRGPGLIQVHNYLNCFSTSRLGTPSLGSLPAGYCVPRENTCHFSTISA